MKGFDGSKIAVVLTVSCILFLVGGGNAEADFILGTPINPGPPVNSSSSDWPGGMTADGLEFYIGSQRPGGYSEWVDLWVMTRPTPDDPWGEPVNLGPAINTERSEFEADLSPDGLILVFTRVETEHPNWGIWMSTRPTRDDPWGQRQNLGPTINSPVEDMDACISADGLTLYFNSRRSGGYGEMDIYVTTRPTRDDPWAEPVNLGPPVNGPYSDACPEISADGRTMIFASWRPGGLGDGDLWMTRRPTIDDPWTEPVHLGPGVNTSGEEQHPDISPDGRWLMFQANRPGGLGGRDIWQAPITPVVDFNGDGTVDIEDLLILIESWGQNDPLVDIGPTPFGDGVVDAADVEVLMEYWGQEASDPSLLAYWRLDETEGIVAYDSVGDNDGTVMGTALWQPDAGQVGGALEFNGATFVTADAVLSPAGGPFSVFAWVKGGAPGQGIIAQQEGANWLMADIAEGNLRTELKTDQVVLRDQPPPPPLTSDVMVTDGDWHRVGFTWDGSARRLYVDDVLVAEDTQTGLADCSGGLNIGCGNDMASGTFFTGLIDDVRIHSASLRTGSTIAR